MTDRQTDDGASCQHAQAQMGRGEEKKTHLLVHNLYRLSFSFPNPLFCSPLRSVNFCCKFYSHSEHLGGTIEVKYIYIYFLQKVQVITMERERI